MATQTGALCKILHPTFNELFDLKDGQTSIELELGSLYLNPLRKANCSILYEGLSGELGEPDLNGNYSGLIGRLQRHEFDFVIYWIRTDYLDHEPVTVGPIFGPADVSIISGKHSPTNCTQNIISTTKTMDFLVLWYFILIWLLIVGLLISFKVVIRTCRIPKHQLTNAHLYKIIKNTSVQSLWFMLGRNSNKVKYQMSWKTIIYFLTLGQFVLLYGYHKNLISVDMTIVRSPQEINSIRDLLSQYKVIPKMFKLLFLKRLAIKSDPSTDLGQLGWKLRQHSDQYVLDWDFTSQESTLKNFADLLEEIINHKTAVCAPDVGFEILKKVICATAENIVPSLHHGSDTFARGSLAFFYSKHMQDVHRKFFDEKLRRFNEFGIYKGYEAYYRRDKSLARKFNGDPEAQQSCMLDIGKVNNDKIPEYNPFNYDFIQPALYHLIYAYVTCFILHILIHVYAMCQLNRKTEK